MLFHRSLFFYCKRLIVFIMTLLVVGTACGGASTCVEVFAKPLLKQEARIEGHQSLEPKVLELLNHQLFPQSLRDPLLQMFQLPTEQLRMVSVSRQAANALGFPKEGHGLYSGLFRTHYSQTADFATMDANLRHHLKIPPNTPFVLSVRNGGRWSDAQEAGTLLHELAHVFFSKTIREHPERIHWLIQQYTSMPNYRTTTFKEADFLDEVFAHAVEILAYPALMQVFRVGWSEKIQNEVYLSREEKLEKIGKRVSELYHFQNLWVKQNLSAREVEELVSSVLRLDEAN